MGLMMQWVLFLAGLFVLFSVTGTNVTLPVG